MAYDQIVITDEIGTKLKIVPVALNKNKKICLLHVFEENLISKKKYIRNELVLVEDQILTSTFADTVHFFEELAMFDGGNDQNKYLRVAEHQATKNLMLKLENEKKIYLSKAEARAMTKIFNLAFLGYSVTSLLENEFFFTPEHLTKLLFENNFFIEE